MTSRERVESELREALRAFLPKQLGDDELAAIVRDAIADCGANSPRDMGRVMKLVVPRVKGTADGKRVSALVKQLLASQGPA